MANNKAPEGLQFKRTRRCHPNHPYTLKILSANDVLTAARAALLQALKSENCSQEKIL